MEWYPDADLGFWWYDRIGNDFRIQWIGASDHRGFGVLFSSGSWALYLEW